MQTASETASLQGRGRQNSSHTRGQRYFSLDEILIGDTVAGLLEERPDAPDEVYLVQTAVDRWAVHFLKDRDNYLHEEDWVEFDSNELNDIATRRADG
jgi:hypothetical protein